MPGVGYVGLSRHTHMMRLCVCVYVRACARRPIMAHKPYNPTPDGGPDR